MTSGDELADLIRRRDALARDIIILRNARVEELFEAVAEHGAAYERAREAMENAARLRADAVAELSALGLSYRDIAGRLGLSAPRVGQLVQDSKARRTPPATEPDPRPPSPA